MRIVWDIESNGLLDHTAIDYTASPYKLKDSFVIHCIAAKDIDTGEVYTFVQDEVKTKFPEFFKKATKIIAHNQINFDLLAIKLYLGIDYQVVGEYLLDEKPINIFDTMVCSKVLNPDRWFGHSVEAWGDYLKLEKIDWRSKAIELGLIERNAPKGSEFATYHPEMLNYCIRDVDVTHKIYDYLKWEWGDWKWDSAFRLEQEVADIITRQSHRGFFLDKELALNNVKELDKLMEEIRKKVEPILPPKQLTKAKLKEFTPPKIQFLKNGEPSSHVKRWVERHNGMLLKCDDKWYATINSIDYELPIIEPIITTEPAVLSSSATDSTHLKGWLITEFGWTPTNYKERDLTTNSKKQKLSFEKYVEAVERYVTQTLASPFCKDRCDFLETTPARLKQKLLKHDIKRRLMVYTNPTLTVGQDKEIDPNLKLIAEEFPYAKDVSNYFTYTHRRNNILGGGVDPDADEDEDIESGILSNERINIDGRIQTPADTCGTATSRMKHRIVANVPRITSVFGEPMRSMYGVNVEEQSLQGGYDFSGLEARLEGHYCWNYDQDDKAYCYSLTLEKPNDVHTKTANFIAEMLEREFGRNPAKNVKFCCAYGGQPKRVAKTIGCSLEEGKIVFDAYWEAAKPLALLYDRLKHYWETKGQKSFVLGIDGRKVPTRSQSALINFLFQSGGVICAKRAMVLHELSLREEGYMIDFFSDNWKSKDFVQQLISYHDEGQVELKRSHVMFKKFSSEEEANNFKDETGKIWSTVIHNDKGYFRAYARPMELAVIAARKAGEYYNLNIPLDAEYIIGRNWGEAH